MMWGLTILVTALWMTLVFLPFWVVVLVIWGVLMTRKPLGKLFQKKGQ